jgi:hypothetical protein
VGRPYKDGSPAKKRIKLCGVWTPHGRCYCPQVKLRRCEYHVECLKADSLYRMLVTAKAAERKIMLDALDVAQKMMPSWTYENPQGEAELMKSAEQERRDGSE